jgi:hypothetical protein
MLVRLTSCGDEVRDESDGSSGCLMLLEMTDIASRSTKQLVILFLCVEVGRIRDILE